MERLDKTDDARQFGRHALGDQIGGVRRGILGAVLWQHLVETVDERRDAALEDLHGGAAIERLRPIAQEPQRRMLEQPAQVDDQLVLQGGGNLVVEALDLAPQIAHVEHRAGHHVGAADIAGAATGFLLGHLREHHARAIDDAVRNLGRDDLAAQPVTADILAVFLDQGVGKITLEIVDEKWIVGQVGFEQLVIERELGVGVEHREFGARETLLGGPAFLDRLVIGQELDRAIEPARAFERMDHPLLEIEPGAGQGFDDADAKGLQVIVGETPRRHAVGHLDQQLVALLAGQIAVALDIAEQHLDVDFAVRAIDPGGIVDGVGIDPNAGVRGLDPRQLGESEIATLADHLATKIGGVDAQRIVRPIADIGVALPARLDIGADTAVPQQVDRRLEQCRYQLIRRHGLGLGADQGAHFRRQGHRFCGAVEDAAAGGDQAFVVIRPIRTRQREQAFALGVARRGIRIGIDEDVQMVERGDQLDMRRQQHAVAKHVARHIADADDAEIVALGVESHFAEMALDRFPRAARGDAHFLVVVAGRAAAGEGVAQPEAIVLGDAVGDIGEGRGALVGGDHEIGIVAIVAHYVGGRHDIGAGEIVGDIEHAGDQCLVAGDAFGEKRVAIARGGMLDHEATLGADRHDDRVLDHLRFHQTENLGAEILRTVGPAETATGHLAAAQMKPFHARRVDEYLDRGTGQWKLVDRHRINLQRNIAMRRAACVGLIEICPQCRLHGVEEAANNPVLVEAGDRDLHIGLAER